MPTIEEKFDQGKIDSLKRYLQKEVQKGRAKDFEIVVDGFKIVPRTNDVTEFDDYDPDVNDNTCNVSILIYDGPKTNRNTCYSFQLKEGQSKDKKQKIGSGLGLGEIDLMIQEKVQEKLDARDKEYEFTRLKEKLAEKDEKLEEAEEYIEKVEKEITDLRAELEDVKKGKIKNLLKQSEGVGSLIFNNVLGSIIKKIPGAEGMAGLFGGEPAEEVQESQPDESAASFEMKNPETDKPGGWDEYKKIFESKFSDEDRMAVIDIVDNLSNNPNRIATVTKLLNI